MVATSRSRSVAYVFGLLAVVLICAAIGALLGLVLSWWGVPIGGLIGLAAGASYDRWARARWLRG